MTYSRVLAAVLCTMALAATCVAQTYTNYQVLSSSDTISASPNWQGGNMWAVDVNNDGIPDLVQEEYGGGYAGAPPPQFGVSIANGDGTFQPPVGYNLPPAATTGAPIAFGDFNGDGNVDLAMWADCQTIAVYLGNGDGTFQNPWYSNISIPSGECIGGAQFAVADFNHDGNVDLALNTTDSNGVAKTIYILPGDGSGPFSTATPLLNLPPSSSTYPIMESLKVGDYDSDDNADLTVVFGIVQASEGNITGTTVHVLYGNGDFTFQDTTLASVGGLAAVGSGDLNSDGFTDLFMIGPSGLETWYGQWGRTFAAYTQQVPGWAYFDTTLPDAVNFPAMADFNDDGLMDLVVTAHDYTNSFLVFFLATPTPGQFNYQTWNIGDFSVIGPSGFAVGDFNGDGSPDWVNHYYYANANSSAPYTIGLNATANGNWSNCPYPITARGISLCTPTSSSTAPVNFDATAHSFGQLRKMEVWVDGNKLAEQHNTWGGNAFLNFDTTSLAAGSHQGTIYAADIDNTLQRYNFNFTVEPSSCGAPSSPGVNICSPTDGSTTSNNQVLVQATATIQGSLARMEIWVDGVKDYTETDSTSLAASLNLRAGSHTITVYAVNTNGTLWSQTITANVP